MVRDAVRFILLCLAMCLASELIVDTRFRLAAVDVAHRASLAGHQPQPVVVAAPEPRPVARLGRSMVEVFDSALSIVR